VQAGRLHYHYRQSRVTQTGRTRLINATNHRGGAGVSPAHFVRSLTTVRPRRLYQNHRGKTRSTKTEQSQLHVE
jgi:hypothetical protein